MAGSLRDQLLKTGLIDEKKAKQAAKEKRDAAKQGKGNTAADESRLRAQQEQAMRAERDREINRKKQEGAARKALVVELRQLVETNRVERKDGELPYRFSDGKRIEKIYVTDVLQQQLARGQFGIARHGRHYVVIPAEAIARIRERDPENRTGIFVAIATPNAKPDADDPYAQFQVPDDLML